MKKHQLALAVAVFSFAMSAFAEPDKANSQPTTTQEPQKTEVFSPEEINKNISYMVGYRLGLELVGSNIDIFDNPEIVKGLNDALDRKNMALTPDQIRSASVALNQELNKAEAKRAKAYSDAGKNYLEENAKRKDVVTTKSGLQYEYLTKGTGETPKASDVVTVKYEGRFIDGTKFDSSENYGGSSEFAVNMVIPAWVEMLQLMHVGDKVTLYAPSNLAYGATGSPPVIPPNTVLVFDLELVGINKAAEPVDAEKTETTNE